MDLIRIPLFRSITLRNFLSFNQEGTTLPLSALNVLIGANASGKSNLIEAFSILRSLPASQKFAFVISSGGGVESWLWNSGERKKDEAPPVATIETEMDFRFDEAIPTYQLSFTAQNDSRIHELSIFNESLLGESNPNGKGQAVWFTRGPTSEVRLAYLDFEKTEKTRGLKKSTRIGAKTHDVTESVDRLESVLALKKDAHFLPVLTRVGALFSSIRIYRDFALGDAVDLRKAQHTDEPGEMLAEDGSNLGVVLNRLLARSETREAILGKLKTVYKELEFLNTELINGVIQIVAEERGGVPIPATRLSSGTLRFLCLLTILLHPYPPPLICIEEPELGLHPDVMNTLAELLIEASTRTQLIVTTHSDRLVSALSGCPESVVVCERPFDGTTLKRLDEKRLEKWLDEYTLGQLWMQGEIGGTRW